MSHRSWMYDRKYPGGRIVKARFKDGVEEFVTYAMSQDIVKSEGGIRCPCIKCMCGSIESAENVKAHLEKVGFMNDYYVWKHHGEREPMNINIEFDVNTDVSSSGAQAERGNFGRMQEMVGDALGVNMSYEGGGQEEIIPNNKALKFYAMMEEVNKPLYEGASDSKLSMCVRLLAAKSNWNVPEDCLEFFSKMMLDATPVKDNMPTSYYDASRLQRLFASMKTASQMTWHYYNKTNSNVMRHPCDGFAWEHFDTMHPDFAQDPRNVRLGLCSDGFTPYIQASATPYYCWPVIVTPYNLPPDMCMTKPYMFLSCIIPGPSNPTDGIDVYLQPLIDDLKRLWIGELTYDIARKENFIMRAALMWTINDFPTYGMLSDTTETVGDIFTYFPKWFTDQLEKVVSSPQIDHLRALANGPRRMAKEWHTYVVNGYKFHTQSWTMGKKTINNGVYVKGVGDGDEDDFYGVIKHIFELSYRYDNNVVLFYCEWFDPTNNGTKIDPKHKNVDIRMDRRYNSFDPFILASKCSQVYYVPYPSHHRAKRGWCSAIKTKPRGQIETEVPDIEVPYQDDEMSHVPDVIEVDPITNLVDKDVDGPQIDAQVLIELLNNNEDDANNSEDNEEDRHIDEEDNEDGIFCSDE
ncbi:unnamed protein product [Trifolium pratense]|uniref:Uncharacterized protein n=1 Tax=Trifolium pratense TaxID=57577 RepID=A0ACB0LI35_TRIPR|nr:unnamed protein product [Trifolium pratense]